MLKNIFIKSVNVLQLAIISLLILYAFLMFAVKLTLTPQYLEVAYKFPNIPDDSYGFSIDDRLTWSKITLEYLNGGFEKPALRKYFFEKDIRVFNSREISHLEDVKNVIDKLAEFWYFDITFLIILGVAYSLTGYGFKFRNFFSYGLWINILTIIFLGIISLLDFSNFFTEFHKVFFTGNSWLFPYDDTLIRLFPFEFWKNAATTISVLSIIYSYIAILILNRLTAIIYKEGRK